MTQQPLPQGFQTLAETPYVSLVTFRRDGREVATPVWIAPLSNRLYVFTERSAGKVKRLRNEARVRLTPCSVSGSLRGDSFSGSARLIEDPTLEKAAYQAFDKKYGWQMRAVNLGSRLAGRIDGRAILEVQVGEAE